MNFKDSVYWQIYGDVWNFHKKYADVQTDDKYWEDVTETAEEIYKKYKCKPEGELAKQLLVCVINELERIYKGMKDGSGDGG